MVSLFFPEENTGHGAPDSTWKEQSAEIQRTVDTLT